MEKLGYTNVKVFHDGLPAWKKEKRPIVSTVNFLKDQKDTDTPTVIIDLRPADKASAAHIPGAVSIAADSIEKSKTLFPGSKSAPIVLYGDDTASAMPAFDHVRGWGFMNTSVLLGGFPAYEKSGMAIAAKSLANEIKYAPKLAAGEIPVDEFKRIAETLPPDKFILDVRDEDEAMQGMIKGAVNIPTQEIVERLGEIPKDKEIVTHCITGTRAELAYLTLKEKGYKARFLNANIEIDAHGQYTITKE